MDFALLSLLNGISYGLLLFMVSAGLTLIFGMMGVLNFAHGSFYMLGAYFGYTLARYGNFWLGLVVAPLLVALIGAAIERFMLRRAHRHGHGHELLLTFGLFFIFEELIKLLYGFYPVEYHMPGALAFTAFRLLGVDYPFYRIFIGGVAVAMFATIYVLLRLTRAGLIVRAAVHRPQMVEALGHDVPMVFLAVFAIGAGMAGLAGAIAGAFYPTSPTMAQELGMIIFVVVVVGGLGSIEGALIASLTIGIFTSFAAGLDWSLASLGTPIGLHDRLASLGGLFALPLSSMAGAIPFFLMLLILLLRPAGLLGEKA
jgi:branched-chain amino acid transport system permease protein